MNFADYTYERIGSIDNVEKWTWINTDEGAYEGPKDDWVQSHKAMIEKHVSRKDLVVQAGGNQGMYPRLLADMFGSVITTEPDPLNFYCLQKNCADKTNIAAFTYAFGETDRRAFLRRPTMQNTGMHEVVEDPTCTQIEVRAIDSLLHLMQCDFLMLDVEGYEFNVLQGAVETIKKFRPVIQVERNNDDILGFLTPLGYTVVDYSKMDTIYKVI